MFELYCENLDSKNNSVSGFKGFKLTLKTIFISHAKRHCLRLKRNDSRISAFC